MRAAGEHLQLSQKHLQRERLLDMEARLKPFRRVAFGVLALALLVSSPELGWWWIAPLAAALAAFSIGDRLKLEGAHPEYWAAASWAVSPLMIAVSVALTGGPESPALAWFALPAVTLGARFENRGIGFGLLWITLLLAGSSAAVDWSAFSDDPLPIVFAFALVLAVTILGGALVQSDRDHRREAVIDPLTGLLNRAALAQRFAEMGADARASGRERRDPAKSNCLALLIGDLDHFKRINDEHGHAVGDAVLKDVAYTLRKHLRALDHVYRVGGEEFVAILPGADLPAAHHVAERLRVAVAESRPAGVEVSISFGAVAAPRDQLDAERMYVQADGALYEAKQAGRNEVRSRDFLAPVPVAG
jgi:diguanylate cyclase (GGDEF)-like protein